MKRSRGRSGESNFCYPNGDFDDRARRAVERCGFETAVTTEPGLNRKSENRYLLKRIAAEPDLPDQYFREQVAGLHAN
jgi:hypothetical protein